MLDLIQVLQDQDKYVCVNVASALKSIGTLEALNAVVILVYSLYRGNTKRSGGISAPRLKQ